MYHYYLRFVKVGGDDILRLHAVGKEATFELIRDHLGMGYILISMEIER